MLRTNPFILRKALEQLEQATLDHAVWRDRLLRVISRRQPCDPNDLAADAHRHCLFGQWYFDRALPALRELPSFAMNGLTSVGAGGVVFQMTASFGMALLDPEVDALESIDRADQALTLAKVAGGRSHVR